ncbi:MAG: hypothetical protein KF773_37360 [Deltaproteobacteria bacterium]|nr:hypothetical protein [Deltaproteobacteria bacterium]MCW5802878.1 hypothetical protein [Deltaproteobacteria bacterium]
MATDDDILTGPVPGPDDEPSAAERAHARTFADLIDKTLAGRTPPAMSTDDRALIEVATVIRAASGGMELPASRQRSIVEDALRQAVGGVTSSGSLATTPITSARRRRWAPWAVAGASTLVAAAAVLAMWLRAPKPPAPADGERTPTAWRSRPSDPLVGEITRAHVDEASARIDVIFADRLEGFRQVRLHRRGGRP